MTDDYEISSEPPRDDQGHPIHPERDHRICGATKSDQTTPTDHGRERDDYDYCLLAAGWGTERGVGPCSKHPIKGEQWGKSNPNYEDGSYAEVRDFITNDATDAEQDFFDELDLEDGGSQFVHDVVKEAYIKYKRTGDERFLREVRQWLSEFNIVENGDEVELTGELDHAVDHDLSEEMDQRIGQMVDKISNDG